MGVGTGLSDLACKRIPKYLSLKAEEERVPVSRKNRES